MKNRISNKMTYLGLGAGLILFALFGILPGSLVGGAAGLSLAGQIFGAPVAPGIMARMIIAVSMLTGIMVSGLIILVLSTTVAWLIGTVIDSMGRREMTEAKVRS